MKYTLDLNEFKKKVIEKSYEIVNFRDKNLKIKFGKMIRSELVFILSNGIIRENSINIASIIEIIHNCAIIIDDIIDNENVRRGEKSLNSKVGDKKAYIIASLMIVRLIKKLVKEDLSVKIFLKILEKMSEAEIYNKNYISTCYNKTGILFAAAILSIIDSYDHQTIKKIYTILKMIGIAYQIKDDIRDNDSLYPKETLNKKLNEYRDKIKNRIGYLKSEEIKNNLLKFIEKYI